MLFWGSRIFGKILQLVLLLVLMYMTMNLITRVKHICEDTIMFLPLEKNQRNKQGSLEDESSFNKSTQVVFKNFTDKDNETEYTNNTSQLKQFLNLPMHIDIAREHKWMVTDKAYEQNIMKRCSEKVYNISSLPDVSVVISFHESEKLSHLLHTLHSIVKHSPVALLREIIMVNDNSRKVDHLEILENYVSGVFPGIVKVVRSNISLGLIRARQLGIRLANANIICSMDAHMEVQDGWLVPIVSEIKKNNRVMVTPYLDWMKPQPDGNWIYEHGSSRYKTVWFWWNMFFTFMELPPEFKNNVDPTKPVVSPCSVGTIWAMDRNFFFEIGGLDEGMSFWGGENIDLPLKVFLFGGQHIHLPCSHAAHLEETGQRSYRLGKLHDTTTNYLRVVETWFTPEYKDVVYYYNPSWKNKQFGDISRNLKLKEKTIHNFSYYMKKFYPEMKAPGIDCLAWGGLENVGLQTEGKLGYCLCAYANQYLVTMTKCDTVVTHNKVQNAGLASDKVFKNIACLEISFDKFRVGLKDCRYYASPHTAGIFWTKEGELRLAVHLIKPTATNKPGSVSIVNYVTVFKTQNIPLFLHYKDGPLQVYQNGKTEDKCLSVAIKNAEPHVITEHCNSSSPYQNWTFERYTEHYQLYATNNNIINKNSSYLNTLRSFINMSSTEYEQ